MGCIDALQIAVRVMASVPAAKKIISDSNQSVIYAVNYFVFGVFLDFNAVLVNDLKVLTTSLATDI